MFNIKIISAYFVHILYINTAKIHLILTIVLMLTDPKRLKLDMKVEVTIIWVCCHMIMCQHLSFICFMSIDICGIKLFIKSLIPHVQDV